MLTIGSPGSQAQSGFLVRVPALRVGHRRCSPPSPSSDWARAGPGRGEEGRSPKTPQQPANARCSRCERWRCQMSDARAEQWLAEMAEPGRWTPTGIEMLRERSSATASTGWSRTNPRSDASRRRRRTRRWPCSSERHHRVMEKTAGQLELPIPRRSHHDCDPSNDLVDRV